MNSKAAKEKMVVLCCEFQKLRGGGIVKSLWSEVEIAKAKEGHVVGLVSEIGHELLEGHLLDMIKGFLRRSAKVDALGLPLRRFKIVRVVDCTQIRSFFEATTDASKVRLQVSMRTCSDVSPAQGEATSLLRFHAQPGAELLVRIWDAFVGDASSFCTGSKTTVMSSVRLSESPVHRRRLCRTGCVRQSSAWSARLSTRGVLSDADGFSLRGLLSKSIDGRCKQMLTTS